MPVQNFKSKILNNLNEWVIPRSQLIAGDNCQEVDALGTPTEKWVYNGTNWLETKTRESPFNYANLSATTKVILPIEKKYDIYLKSFEINYSVTGKNEVLKYWNFNLYTVDANLNEILIQQQNSLASAYNSLTFNINLYNLNSVNQTLFYQITLEKIGTGGNISASGKLNYQYWRNHAYN